jgi:hypothetical protein
MIWESGVLQRINAACGSEISDYEEVELTVPQLKSALAAVSTIPIHATYDVMQFVENLIAMMLAAIEADSPLYFVF